MKLSAPPPPSPPPPPPPPPSDGPGENAPASPDEQPQPNATPARSEAAPAIAPKLLAWPSWYAGVDAAIVALVLLLTFVAASFVARNSDVWVHLAAGKRMFAGEYFPGGSDPFSYTAAGRTWVNHTWLTDAVAYLLYGGSGSVLIVAKALLVALTFGLLIAIRRPQFSLWPWAAVACVSMIAAAPQFVLRPLVVSMFLLAVTLYLLFRVPHKRDSWRFPIAIGVTFWVWANSDEWFFIGPLALALLLVGDLIQKYVFNITDEAESDADPLGRLPDTVTLAIALGIGVLACLLTPHHVRVLELPFELTGARGADMDPRISTLFIGPTESVYINNASLGANANGFAYAALFVLGGALFGAVFGLGLGRVRIAHIALWLGFALLSLASVYTIPFFAVIAVPLLASQFNGFSAKTTLKTWGDPKSRLLIVGSSGGRVLSVLALCVLCVLAYPGWLHPDPSSPVNARRIAWEVEPDPALKRAAEQFQAWRANESLPPDARGFITHVDLANYVAWFAPKEKVFLNTRFNHHRPELADFVTVRGGLRLIPPKDDGPRFPDTLEVLKRHNPEYVALLANPGDALRFQFAAHSSTERLHLLWGTWSVWYLDGRTTVFGWRPEGQSPKPSFAKLRVDPTLQVFGPAVEKRSDAELKQPLVPAGWEEPFVRIPRAAPPGVAEAMGLMDFKTSLLRRQQIRTTMSQVIYYTLPATQHSFHQLSIMAAEVNRALRFPGRYDEAEVDAAALHAIPILALRAARRAIAENPDHPEGYFALGRVLSDPDLPFTETERAQGRVTAYRQCLKRMPPPDRYKRGQFALSGTDVAQALAHAYLGDRLTWTEPNSNRELAEYTGIPIDIPAIPRILGQPLFSNRRGVIARGQPTSADMRRMDNHLYFLPLDLAREALQLGEEYAVIDFAGERNEETKKLREQWELLRKDVDKAVIQYKNKYTASKGNSTKLPDLVDRAVQFCMIGQAIELLSDSDAVAKDYGVNEPFAVVNRVALKLATGQIEDADEILKSFSKPDEARVLEQAGLAPLVQRLKYKKVILAGEYKAAGEVLASIESRSVGLVALLADIAKQKIDPNKLLLAEFGRMPPPLPGGGFVPSFLAFRFLHETHEQVLSAREVIANKMQQDASYFARRGTLAVLEGDIPAAKDWLKQARRDPPPGWRLSAVHPLHAAQYLAMIEMAEKKVAVP